MENQPDLPLSQLTTLSPLDGRYRDKIAPLATYLSEFSLTRVRVEVECAYLVALSNEKIIRELTREERVFLEELGPHLSIDDVKEIKQIEEKLKHDVKAVEIYLREKISNSSLLDVIEFIHFGITSEDINNISYRLMLKRATEHILLPQLIQILQILLDLSETHKAMPFLGRTHGQPAVPTTLGKELLVFASRLSLEIEKLQKASLSGKIAGATGNYNALSLSYPDTDWSAFAKTFVTGLKLNHSPVVTQINTYEDIIEYFQIIQRINNILLDFNQDMWRYISDGWFIQEVKKDEVGSSTMPQKVNPIFFENAEGNIGIANAFISFFVQKLAVSRLQRDLSDSTVIRNVGSALGYSFLSYQMCQAGLNRIRPNEPLIHDVLMNDWSILSEAAQTLLRKEGVKDPYSLLKSLTRGERIDETAWKKMVQDLPIKNDIKLLLETLTPTRYIGIAPEIVVTQVADIKKRLSLHD